MNSTLPKVAAAALRVMHYKDPVGPWSVDDLPDLEQKTYDGHSICEAGCYQCLLSYFNQPDHDHINRRNAQAIEMLVALANAQVTSASAVPQQDSSSAPATASQDQGDEMFENWRKALLAGGFQPPDQYQAPALGGALTVAGLYKSTRTAVVVASPSPAHAAALLDKGFTVVDMSVPELWSLQFSQHTLVFGSKY